MRCLHNWASGPCQGELMYHETDEPYSYEHYMCEVCFSTYNVPEIQARMKPAYALSYSEFADQMKKHALDDSNIETKKSALIEIAGEQDALEMLYFKQDHSNVLRILFDDVDEPYKVYIMGELSAGQVIEDEREYRMVVPMSVEQGKQILEFVKKHRDATNFIVHCAAGISRSGAVAKFITEYFGGDDRGYVFLNPHTQPNSRILKILRELSQQSDEQTVVSS